MSATLVYDVSINVHKGQSGYGIYFAMKDGGGDIFVTKVDEGSEAQKAGVQIGDKLVAVSDLNKKLPVESPGQEVAVTTENYHKVLDLVRGMTYCCLKFLSKGAQAFM
uniref:PDZ domain-containing protein n=1 Tax=Chrysotila carterae TaxID=13221 RepID=A0A7S4C4W7_CHRCT|mmetsp:Transcript_32772/g.71942  ORF Transcript_32772/g.71942 Transcript_32772/m.71942 type:complete len:108 (+) Transcript_32772:319-642(+)|eukprot:6193089-Pleurochrysis_carterae.AAC.5